MRGLVVVLAIAPATLAATARADGGASSAPGDVAPSATTTRVSGFLQVDWVVHNQASQDEINGSTGAA
jgi:hypothetical protein